MRIISQNLYGLASGASYFVDFHIGQPLYSEALSQNTTKNIFNLLVDTGSSNDAVAAEGCCNPDIKVYTCSESSSCKMTQEYIQVTYQSAEIEGHLVSDTFSGSQIGVRNNVIFMEIEKQQSFVQSGFQGILGLAYQSIAQPTSDPPNSVTQVILESGMNNIFSLLLCGTLQTVLQGKPTIPHAGQWIFGGIEGPNNEQYYAGSLYYTPLVQEQWYVVLVTKMGFNEIDFSFSCKDYNTPRAIVDSGTTNLILPSAIYNEVVNSIRSSLLALEPRFSSQYLSDEVICCEDYCDDTKSSVLSQLPSIHLNMALENSDDDTYQEFSIQISSDYYWRPLSPAGNQRCRIFGITEANQLILGNVFMDGLYTIHQRERKQVGFGIAANCPNQIESKKQIISSNQKLSDSWCDCLSDDSRISSNLVSYWPWKARCFFWHWWMYVILVSVVIIILSLIYIIFKSIQIRIKRRRQRDTSRRNMVRNYRQIQTPQPETAFDPESSDISQYEQIDKPNNPQTI